MTFGEAIEQIYLNVNGGILSIDNVVHREDIRPYFGVALARAISDRDRQNFLEKIKATRAGLPMPSNDATLLYVSATMTAENADCHAVITPGYSPLTTNGAIHYYVLPCDTATSFIKLKSLQQYIGLEGTGPVYYWHEYTPDFKVFFSTDIAGQKVKFYASKNIADVSDEEELFVTKEAIADAIDTSTRFFMQQKHGPMDLISDGTDNKQGYANRNA